MADGTLLNPGLVELVVWTLAVGNTRSCLPLVANLIRGNAPATKDHYMYLANLKKNEIMKPYYS